MSAKVPPSTTEKYGLLKTPGIEHHRLARAFYHLELYGILFYDPDNDEDVITVTEQANFFRVKLRDWELEEFLCVREYLLEELSHYLNKIEDDFLQEYINDGPPADIATKPFDMRFCHEDEDWYFFSDDGQLASIQNRWREVTLTRGLKTLHTIFQSRTPEQRENILGNIEIDRPRNTMNQTLEGHFSTRYRAGPHQTVIDVLPRSGNSLDEFNHAWLWTSRYWSFQLKRGNTSHENHSYIHEPPRRWGYVIWSNETLKILGVLEKPKSTDWTCEGGVLKTLLQSR